VLSRQRLNARLIQGADQLLQHEERIAFK
jgi:hypothetical protein